MYPAGELAVLRQLLFTLSIQTDMMPEQTVLHPDQAPQIVSSNKWTHPPNFEHISG